MGQDDIYKYLRKVRRWTTSKELSRILGSSVNSINACILKLRKNEPKLEMKKRTHAHEGNHYRIK